MLITGLEAARRPDEKRQAVSGLGQVPHLLALQAVVPCMGNPDLREEAAYAAVLIGNSLAHDSPEAVKAAVEKALAVSRNDGLKQFAEDVLARAEKRLKETRANRP
jgi:hypothetical protein